MIKQFLGNQRGNFVVTMALTLIPVSMAAGIAADYSMASRFKSRLQAGIDAATLAAGVDLATLNDAQVAVRVDEYLKANLDPLDYRQLQGAPLLQIDRDSLSLRVDVRAQMPTSFAGIIGIGNIDYAGSASIRSGWGALEAVLVLDNTGSMASENRLVDLKKAAGNFIDTMSAASGPSKRVRIGLVPFADYVNVGTANSNASWLAMPVPAPGSWQGCVGSRPGGLALADSGYSTPIPPLFDVACPTPITPLTTNLNFLKTRINAMQPSGMTYVAEGLAWGVRAISAEAPFTEGSTAAIAARDNITKTIILMTDGENTVSKNVSTPRHDGRDVAAANSATLALCTQAKAQGIRLFTLTFGRSVPAATKSLIAQCASAPEDYFDASDGQALSAAFEKIGESLTRLHLTH